MSVQPNVGRAVACSSHGLIMLVRAAKERPAYGTRKSKNECNEYDICESDGEKRGGSVLAWLIVSARHNANLVLDFYCFDPTREVERRDSPNFPPYYEPSTWTLVSVA